jgi:hypothetical protein
MAINVRFTLVYILLTSIALTSLNCYKTVPIDRTEPAWWEKGQTWIKTRSYDRWIKVKHVEADSVYGELNTDFSTSAYKTVVVPLLSVEQIERRKVDPSLTVLGIVLLAGGVLAVIYLVQVSNIELD